MHVLATSFQWVQQDIHLKIIWIWTNGKVLKAETGNYKTEVKIADFRSGPRGGPIGFFSDRTVRSGPKKIRVRKFLGKKIRTKSGPIGPGKSLVLLIPSPHTSFLLIYQHQDAYLLS